MEEPRAPVHTIENARYVVHDRYPLLEVEINGVAVRLMAEWKPTLREQGVVMIGGVHADVDRE